MTLPEGAPDRVPLQELVGQRLGDYAIQRVLGHGSMGVVFEAMHEKLGRRVALKVLPPGLGATEKAIQRFLREAQAVAQLSHDNIVPIYEVAHEGATHYYAMQFLDGLPLDKVVRGEPLDPKRAAELALTAARAVHFAHQRGIIHRDIKPANMILQKDGKLVLTDFGLARPEQGGSITDSGAMVGTPLYMSPEQVRAKRGEVDRRTDIYSLGATLYELLTGRPPFQGDSTQEILQQILEAEPKPPRAWNSSVPFDLEVITLKTLEKEPKRRYASALDLAQDLERFLEGEPVRARRTTAIGRGWRRVKKHKTIAILSALVAIVALGASFTIKLVSDSERGKEFRVAIDTARNAFAEESYLTALKNFETALTIHKDDVEAHLGRARARCFLGQEWENAEQRKETRPELARQFTSIDKLYADARSDVDAVLKATPNNSLALFYRGFLGCRSRQRFERDAGFDDLYAAETKGADDWETQGEFARFRFGLARTRPRDDDQRGELLQQALTNASLALDLSNARQRADASKGSATVDDLAAQRSRTRLHRLRAEIYYELYDTAGNARQYLDLCKTDCEHVLQKDARDQRALMLLDTVKARLVDAEKTSSAAAAPDGTRVDTIPSQEITRRLLVLLGVAEKSPQSEALASLMQRGGEWLASGLYASWQKAGELRDGLVDRFVNPFLSTDLAVSAEDRITAAAAADAARRILQTGLQRGETKESERRDARDRFRLAVAKNPRNAQYLFELGVVEQALGEFEPAHDHLARATKIATSNPLFFRQLALVCEQMKRLDEAVAGARRADELAGGNPDFMADHVRLAVENAKATADRATRAALLEEARARLDELKRVAPDHAQVAPLTELVTKAASG